jgi:glycerophosphoryl diester phosphodiesterase
MSLNRAQSKHAYLDSPHGFKIFAHRGLCFADNRIAFDENTIPAFQAAVSFGVEYLELDVQCSLENKAVVFHDETLDRVTSATGRVKDFTLEQLQSMPLKLGGRICSLDEVFLAMPKSCRINIDIKNSSAIPDVVNVIEKHQAQRRVLLTSFSEARRLRAIASLPGVATSPSAAIVFKVWLGIKFGFGYKKYLESVNALQIPVSYGLIRFDSPRFIESVKRHGVELVYWTINDPVEAKRLQQLGANGIVTDRSDLMVSALKLG